MSEPSQKTLRDYEPSPFVRSEAQPFPSSQPFEPIEVSHQDANTFDQRGTSQSDRTPEKMPDSSMLGSLHQWKGIKITTESEDPEEEGFQGVRVRGGTVYSQVMETSQEFEVEEQEFFIDEGFVYLRIERDPDTWEVIEDGVTMEHAAEVPISDYIQQNRALLRVIKTEALEDPEDPESDLITTREIEQLQFEEIRIRQELTIQNGEFQLGGYEMSHRNTYDLS